MYDVDTIISNNSNVKIARQNILIKNKVGDFEIKDFNTSFGFDSGNANFNILKSNYYLDGDICNIDVEVDITNPSTTGYSMYFYLPFKAKKGNDFIDIAFSNCNATKLSAFTLEDNTLCYIKQSGSNMNALRPNQITSGAKLIIKGSYLINGRYS